MNSPDPAPDTGTKECLRVIGLLAAVFVLIWWLPIPVPVGTNTYLPLHTSLEVLAIAMAMLVVAIGWHAWQRAAPRPVLLIATAFLGVAAFDLSHLLSYQGMPDYVTPSDTEKAIIFWLAARLLAAIALLVAAIMHWPAKTDSLSSPPAEQIKQRQHSSARFRRHLLVLVAIVVITVHGLVLFRPHWLPAMFDPATGLTPLKIASEWLIVSLHLATAALLWQKRRRVARIDVNALILAVLIMALSELFFTLYTDVTDLYNLMGHVYKIIAYYYLYRALVISGIDQPYRLLATQQARQQATLDVLPDMVLEIDQDGQVHQFHSNHPQLLSPHGVVHGSSLFDLLPAQVSKLIRQMLLEISQRGRAGAIEYSLPVDGEERWYEAIGAAMPSHTGAHAHHYILLIRDVSDNRQVRIELERSQRLITTAFDNMPFGIAINTVTAGVSLMYMNKRFAEIYDVDPALISDVDSFWREAYPDEKQRQQIRQRVLEDIGSGDPERMIWDSVEIVREGKPTRHVAAQNIPLPDDELYLSLVFDVSERVRAEQELRIAAAAFESQEAIMITDAEQRILRVNRAFEQITGYKEQELQGQTPQLLQSGKHGPEFYQAMWRSLHEHGRWRGEVWNRRKNGELYSQRLFITAIKNDNGEVTHYLADFMDTSALREAHRRIDELALFDPLTGLSNRQRLLEQLQLHLMEHHQHQRFGGLIFIDIDQFKTINDTSGYEAGDLLLLAMADRLKNFVGSKDLVARNGADEFVIIFDSLGKSKTEAVEALQHKAESLLAKLSGDFEISGRRHHNSVSLGMTVFHGDQFSAAELLKQVDLATHQVKRVAGSHIGFYDPTMQELVARQASLESDLRQAIKEQQFQLYYQPLVDEHEQIRGAEALLRWRHPTRGLLPPRDFIDTVERTGMIHAIERWVLESALAQLQRWQCSEYTRHWQVSINIAVDPFYDDAFCSALETLLTQYQLDGSAVLLEFTESILLRNIELAREKIIRLSALGVRFAIDDFGTGYSSLAYLSQLPVHELKIDQSFIHSLDSDPSNAAIIRMIVEMAGVLQIDVVAEGVETREQFDYLKNQGCNLFQGYLFSHPVAELLATKTRP